MACRLTLTHAFNLAVAANVALYRRASARVDVKVVLRNASRNAVFAATLPRRHDVLRWCSRRRRLLQAVTRTPFEWRDGRRGGSTRSWSAASSAFLSASIPRPWSKLR